MKFNADQEEAIRLALHTKRNLFVTGGAGVGKSAFIDAIRHKIPNAVVVAPTGIAALNVTGATIHKTFRLPFHILTDEDVKNKDPMWEMDNITLIIDEVGMVRSDIFENIERSLRLTRRSNAAFGGVRVICVGDFYQIPPVLIPREQEAFFDHYTSVYAFGTGAWQRAEFVNIELKKVERSEEPDHAQVMNMIRTGTKIEEIVEWLNSFAVRDPQTPDLLKLCTTNATADQHNYNFFDSLDTPVMEYKAKIIGKLTKDTPVPEFVHVRKGCRVVICANGDGYVNGDAGVVSGTASDYVIVKLDRSSETVLVRPHEWTTVNYTRSVDAEGKRVLGKTKDSPFTQIPIKLGWAITIHKSQGMSLRSYSMNLGSGSFTHGQTYVGISRITNLDRLYLDHELHPSDFILDDEVTQFYNTVKFHNVGDKV